MRTRPNPAAPGNGAMALLFQIQHLRRAVPEQYRQLNMNPLEFIGELCTLDSAFVRGWRWSFSSRYREAIRLRSAQQRPLFVVAGVLETVGLMLAEVVALVFIVRWLLTL